MNESNAEGTSALLELQGVRRDYRMGDEVFAALHDLDLTISAGEMVAIVGPSGSGKSTLMNILGCLDRPTTGSYRVAGVDVATLDSDALASLRRERFGFIFQRYNLLPDLTALENVEVPAVYAGKSRAARRERATDLLTRLKLADRLGHRPNQLSGGQQQRVSIARALMNGGEIILADEPTGALDSHVGEEVLSILKELHSEGHTIILVTHDLKVAEHAERIVQLMDGQIVSDRRTDAIGRRRAEHVERAAGVRGSPWSVPSFTALWDRSREALHMALLAMQARRMRTFLTMLGIIIGIAAVASVVALGQGGEQQVLAEIRGIGTNTLDIYPGNERGDERATGIRTLVPADAEAIATLDYIDSVTPTVQTNASLRFGDVAVRGSIHGVGESYFRVHDLDLDEGEFFSAAETQRLAQVVVVDDNTRRKLFGTHQAALHQVIFIGTVPFRVIGVTKRKDLFFENPEDLNVWAPYTSIMGRMLGQRHLRSISARVSDGVSTGLIANSVTRLLERRHGRTDFYVHNTDAMLKAFEASQATLTLLVSSIAVISLIVGGIGVMNIMLVSVTERTREIGVRAAVGARYTDILQQFLIEAVLVCLIGGTLGVLLALGFGVVFSHLVHDFPIFFSFSSVAAAVAVSTLIGMTFGYLPARNAARLDPATALAWE